MKLFRALAAVVAMGLAAPVGAVINKCVNKDGSVSWTDKPCTVYQAPNSAQSGASAPSPEQQVEAEPVPEAVPERPAAAPAPQEPAPAYESDEPAEPSPEELQQMQEEQMAAIEAEWERRVKRKLPLIIFLFVATMVGWVWQIVTAARMDKVLWAIGLFFLAPVSNIIFTALNWQRARAGFLLYMISGALLLATYVSLYAGMVSALGEG